MKNIRPHSWWSAHEAHLINALCNGFQLSPGEIIYHWNNHRIHVFSRPTLMEYYRAISQSESFAGLMASDINNNNLIRIDTDTFALWI